MARVKSTKAKTSRVKSPEASIEYQRMDYLASWMNKNKKLVVAGTEIPGATMTKLFNTSKPVYGKNEKPDSIIAAYKRHKSQMVAWQNRFNRLLAQRGLYMSIKSDGGSDRYVFKTKDECRLKVVGFYNDASKKEARGKVLSEGIDTHESVFKRSFTKDEIIKAWGKSVDAGTNAADDGKNKGIRR